MKLLIKNPAFNSFRCNLLYLWRFIATISFRKVFNFYLNHFEYKRSVVKLKSLPPQVIIDITNICNLKCPLCPTGLGLIDRSKGRMSFELYEDLLDQLKTKTQVIHLYNWGEPLLLKDFPRYCEIARHKGFVVSTSSNLSMKLDQQQVIDIINSGLDRLIVSFDGLTERTYNMYRLGGDYKRLLENLELFIQTKKSLRKKYPLIVIQFVRHKGNQTEIADLANTCYKLGADKFQVVDILLPFGQGKDPVLIERWITEDRLHTKNEGFEFRQSDLGKVCEHLWKYPVINHDGSISPCCFVYLTNADMGKINQSSFIAAWNSEKYQTARKMFAERKIVDCPPCSGCSLLKSYLDEVKH
jgi:radical SAM protein with 4Fe4S-binding SPASM domain